MDKMAALMEKNLQLLLENVEELTDEELEEETLEEYRAVQGASEAAFQIRLPEDFRALLLLQALPQLSAQGKHTVHMVVGDDIHRVGIHGNSLVPHHRAAVG